MNIGATSRSLYESGNSLSAFVGFFIYITGVMSALRYKGRSLLILITIVTCLPNRLLFTGFFFFGPDDHAMYAAGTGTDITMMTAG